MGHLTRVAIRELKVRAVTHALLAGALAMIAAGGQSGGNLSRGMFYYDRADVSDVAVREFTQVIEKGGADAEAAQYYLASYHHRKYYILRAKWRRDDAELLRLAITEYIEYLKGYEKRGSGKWLSDARFNLALAYLQVGKVENVQRAIESLEAILRSDSNRDSIVFVPQVLWSPMSEDVINSEHDARRLAEFALASQRHLSTFEEVVLELKRWCRQEKSRQ